MRFRRLVSAAIALAVTAGFAVAAAPAISQEAPAVSCEQLRVPVSLTPGGTPYTIVGDMCRVAGSKPQTVALLVHGGTYDRRYWEFPFDPARYSFVRNVTSSTVATFAVDRLGDGQSSHPPGLEVTVPAGAYALHEVIQALRDGSLGSADRFPFVLWIGHSFGSLYGQVEASTYHDVDAVMLTGDTHYFRLTGVVVAAQGLELADAYPQFQNLDIGYLATRPGWRERMFYNAQTADPAVVNEDEAIGQTVTVSEVADLPMFMEPTYNRDIQVPVMIVDGSLDNIFVCSLDQQDCTTSAILMHSESPFYTKAACLDTGVIPDTGHDLNLSTTASQFFAIARTWTRAVASMLAKHERPCVPASRLGPEVDGN